MVSRIISRRTIKSRIRRKTNPQLKNTLALALKNKSWNAVTKLISASSRVRKKLSLNLSEIDSQTKAGDTVLIPGKVLSLGELTKKVRICSLSISKKAKEKLKSTKSEFAEISEEIKKNPKMDGVKILK